jgi:type I restriction-modification system DNA methylase subunit/hemerythrin
MGYTESSCLKYGRDGFNIGSFSSHTAKVLEELSPYAVYIVDDEPFVLFFEELFDKSKQQQLCKKIWNAQIPVAIVCEQGTVIIYNGCSIDRQKSLLAEVERIPVEEINENSPFSYWEITNQDMWVNCAAKFSGEKLNDCLLRNLSEITERLKKEYKVKFATKLVLRLIFIRYLIDRGVDIDYTGFSSDVESSRGALLHLLKDKKKLYNLFEHLKKKFNGNLFELENEIDDNNLTEGIFLLLSDFLSANIESKTGQLSFFDLYDFNIIPVELISNIYEILLGKEERKKDNAFYTPRYLVDYILDGSVSPFVRDKGRCKVLDPSCGSGIFLVESYRRIIEKELDGKHITDDDELLKKVLTDNIYGVDLNPDAVDVTIFSLYLAVLDYKNPKTLNSFTLPPLRGSNIFVCNFFNEEKLLPLQSISFDFIIGNPPWGKGTQLQDEYLNKRSEYKQYMQKRDTCRAFILRSKDFCKSKTQNCFVLHSTMLYMQKQPSKTFRKYLLTNTEIIRIIELSSVRTLIFKDAKAPAVILSFRFSDENAQENRFEYISMKPNVFFKLFNIIVVEKTDTKYVQQKLLKEHDWAWKTIVYGLTGDIDTILSLKKMFPSIKQSIKKQTPKLLNRTGVKYSDGDKNDASHLVGRPLIDSDAIDHFSIDLTRKEEFAKKQIDRPRDERLFHGPYCLVRRGLDMSNYTMKAVYAEESFVFRETLYAIKGSIDQKSFLLNITGLLNSSTYAYLNLMLNSSLGVEREVRQATEVLSFPFVSGDDIAQLVENVQKTKAGDSLFMQEDISAEIKLNETILKAFQLSDNEFVDYALRIQIPQLTEANDHDVYRHVSGQDLKSYAQYFYNYLSDIFSRTNQYIKVVAYPKVARHYSILEVIVQEKLPKEWFQVGDDNNNKELFAIFSSYKINDKFYYLKDTLYFDKHSFYIIKPSHYKNWHPAMAKLDLMDVVDQILSRNGGNV